jgi:hypothetical protein
MAPLKLASDSEARSQLIPIHFDQLAELRGTLPKEFVAELSRSMSIGHRSECNALFGSSVSYADLALPTYYCPGFG